MDARLRLRLVAVVPTLFAVAGAGVIGVCLEYRAYLSPARGVVVGLLLVGIAVAAVVQLWRGGRSALMLVTASGGCFCAAVYKLSWIFGLADMVNMRLSCEVAGLALLLAACSAEGTKTVQMLPDCTLPTITVSPPYATLHPGDTVRANASRSVCPQDTGPALTYRWRSSDTSVAVVDSVAGLVRARKTGTASVIVTATAAPSVQGAMALNVVP